MILPYIQICYTSIHGKLLSARGLQRYTVYEIQKFREIIFPLVLQQGKLPDEVDWCLILRIDPNGDVWTVSSNDKKDRFCHDVPASENATFEEKLKRVSYTPTVRKFYHFSVTQILIFM